MGLTKRRRILLLVVMVSTLAVISVQVVASSLFVSNVEYGTSLVLVQGLHDGVVQGTTQGLVLYSNVTDGGADVQLWTVDVMSFSTKMIASFTSGDGAPSLGYMTFDGYSNAYYVVGYPNATELIVRQLWDFGTFTSPQVIYKDNPCGVPTSSSCNSGIFSIAVSPGATVYFAENFPISGTPVGNGTSEIKELPAGASSATTLLSKPGNNTIDEIAYATKYLYFTYRTSSATQLERFVLKSGTYSSVASFPTQYVGDVNIAPSPPSKGW